MEAGRDGGQWGAGTSELGAGSLLGDEGAGSGMRGAQAPVRLRRGQRKRGPGFLPGRCQALSYQRLPPGHGASQQQGGCGGHGLSPRFTSQETPGFTQIGPTGNSVPPTLWSTGSGPSGGPVSAVGRRGGGGGGLAQPVRPTARMTSEARAVTQVSVTDLPSGTGACPLSRQRGAAVCGSGPDLQTRTVLICSRLCPHPVPATIKS